MDNPVFSETDLKELREAFFEQSAEILEDIPHHIMAMEEGRSEEGLKALKRSFHTLKGDSMAMGFGGLGSFAHKIEEFISGLNSERADREAVNILLECSDSFCVFIEAASKGAEPDVSSAMQRLQSRGPRADIDNRTGPIDRRAGDAAGSMRIESSRVDGIMNLVGELVIGRSMLGRIAGDFDEAPKEEIRRKLEYLNSSLEKTVNSLQRSVMKMRMLPIERVFRKFPRIVRDVSNETGKKMRLTTEGGNTELDKGMMDAIGEPLLHIVRNAAGHGIERPEKRLSIGKPEEGAITMRASHHGNQIVIDVEDDGAGMDAEAMTEKAVRMGILTRKEASGLSAKEALNLAFVSGFSTAEAVTEVSGRGVGMDAVKHAVESLRGMIHITSAKGRGTCVTLRLPLTLAIIKALLFQEGPDMYALPLSSVTEIIRADPERLDTYAGAPVLKHRDGVVPLCSVNGNHAGRFAILMGVSNQRAGLMADAILGEESLVIKALDKDASSGPASGASILGDGRLVLILDPLLLMRSRKGGPIGIG